MSEGALCGVKGCGGKVKARGWCTKHYQRQAKGLPMEGPLPPRQPYRRGSTEATLPLGDSRHGVVGYVNHRCRCGVCRAAMSAYRQDQRARKRAEGLAPDALQHGTVTGYDLYGCRCDPCTAAHRAGKAGSRGQARAVGLPVGDPAHGTPNGYTYYGCRCAACTAASTEHMAWARVRKRGAGWVEARAVYARLLK